MITNHQQPKILCPTLHFYHYVLRNSLNDSDQKLVDRRKFFIDNLQQLTQHLRSKDSKKATDFIKLIPPEQEISPSGSLLDLTGDNIPDNCKTPDSDRLYLETGIITSRLAVRRLNDTYLLRFISYIPSAKGTQDLEIFGNLSQHLSNLPIELGQTAILAGILPKNDYQGKNSQDIASECLSHYCGEKPEIIKPHLIVGNFLGSPFYLYSKTVVGKLLTTSSKTVNIFPLQSTHLMGVILYEGTETEAKANKFYNILQDMLLSYHKINFFYYQSLALKQLISQQYQEIEQLTKDYANTKWNKELLKQLPRQSLEFYQKLSFLADQEKTIRVNLYNYRECLKQIADHTGDQLSGFFVEFINDTEYYLKQIETTIGFMSPGLQLYDKLMLSVQTQVSIDDEAIQQQQSDQQQKLGQLLTGSCAAIAIGQILTPAITTSVSYYWIDKDSSQPPSLTSLWLGAILTILLSVLSGVLVSRWVYRWFTKNQ